VDESHGPQEQRDYRCSRLRIYRSGWSKCASR